MDDQQNQQNQQNVSSDHDDSSRQTIRNLTITIDRGLCIGAASCVAVAPKAFSLDEQAKAIILPTVSEETDENIIDAARSCPVAAIIIHDNTGKQIFP